MILLALLSGCIIVRSHRPVVYYAPHDPLVQHALDEFQYVHHSMDVVTADISSPTLARALVRSSARGIVIRIITAASLEEPRGWRPPDCPSQISYLRTTGAHIAVRRLSPADRDDLPHEFAVLDGRRLWVGSWNWRDDEPAPAWDDVLSVNDPQMIERFQATFERLWGRSGY